MTRYLSFLYGPTISGCHGKAVENVKLYSFLMLFGDIFIISHQCIGQHLSLPPMYWTASISATNVLDSIYLCYQCIGQLGIYLCHQCIEQLGIYLSPQMIYLVIEI